VFKSLPVARAVCRVDSLPDAAGSYRRDTITLGWEERLKTRVRRRSDGGFEFGMALPRGTALRAGDCLLLDAEQVAVEVVEDADPVLVIRPASTEQWGLFAYFIGNSHQPMMIAGDVIVCPDVPGMDRVLEYHEIPFSRDRRAFTPVSFMGDAIGPAHQHAPPLG
jgi:urease accessory protein